MRSALINTGCNDGVLFVEDTSEALYCRHGDKGCSVSVRGVLSYVKALQSLGMLNVSVKL